MLEGLVANVLNRTLGSYVENFDTNQLNIGIWSGDVTLNHLKLKSESLDKLDLPLNLIHGQLNNLKMQIPWSNLKSKPVKILIEDCYMLITPKMIESYNENVEKELRVKLNKLKSLEASQSIEDLPMKNNQTFNDSLISKIIDNLQVTIKNIHIRYEDFDCFTKTPIALGFTLTELSAVSTDENWVENFIENVSSISRKLLSLKSLSIYLDTSVTLDSSIVENSENKEKIVEIMKEFIEKCNDDNIQKQIEYLLQPVSGTGHLTLNKLGATDHSPHYNLNLFFDKFNFNLNHLQYLNILESTSKLNYYQKTIKFKKNRPNCTIMENPSAWLKYSFDTIFNEIHERNYRKSWDYIKIRRDERKLYVRLWKKRLVDEHSLTADDLNQLKELEIKCEYEDLRFYRSLARLQYKKEFQASPASKASSAQSSGGWFSSWWKSSDNDTHRNATSISVPGGEEDSDDDDIEITDEQLNEFYDAIEFDGSQGPSTSLDIPRERVELSVSCKLKTGCFVIKESPQSRSLAEFISEGCIVDFIQRTDSHFVSFKLNKFSVEDGSDDTLYKHIVSVKQTVNDINDIDEEIPFFQVSFENNPLSEVADSEIIAKLSSMTIFHNTRFIESLYKFFRSKNDYINNTIGSLMNAAESTIQDFTKQTKIGLQYAFEEHKTMNCQMDLQAPLIILPVDPTKWDSPVGILDAGHISIMSDLISKDKYKQIKDDEKDKYTEKDWNRLNSFMYDKYDLSLQDAQILIGPDIKTTIEDLHNNEERNKSLILDQLSMKFLVELSILPTFFELPKIKVSGDIPRFKAGLSDFQYKVVMQLLEKSIPNFETDAHLDSDIDQRNYNNYILNNINQIDNITSFEKMEYLKDSSNIDEKEIGDSTNLSNSTSNLCPALNQHEIEFNFKIDLILLSLKRCSNISTFDSDTLVDVVGESLEFTLYKTPRLLNVDLSLGDLTVNDYIETSSIEQFKKLISSKVNPTNKSHENIFFVNYQRSLRLVNYHDEIIECFDQDIKLDVSDFQVVLSRKSILTLLNYSLNTFTDPTAPELPSDKLRHNTEQDMESSPNHINVEISLNSINLILNDDGIKLGTLILDKADINVFMLPDSMKVSSKIGGLTLTDTDTHEGRKLINIEGDNNLAELFYETYDTETNSLPYDSSFKFETQSIHITFFEDSFSKIYVFLNKFQRMKYIYDKARDAALNQANNVEYSTKVKFDVLIRTPIFVFPKPVDPVKNLFNKITVNLGEIHTFNQFNKTDNSEYFNIIKAGLSNTKIYSNFLLTQGDEESKVQDLEIIDKLNVDIDVDYYDGVNIDRPMTIISGGVTGNEMKLTEFQAFNIIQIFESFSRISQSSAADDDENIEEIEADANNANILLMKDKSSEREVNDKGTLRYSDIIFSQSSLSNSNNLSIQFMFDIPILSLTIFNETQNVSDIKDKSLSKFSLNKMAVKLKMFKDGNFESDILIKSFVVDDVRANTKNFFRSIIPEVDHTEYQFMSHIKSGNNKILVDLGIDSPQLILAMDYLFALKSFADYVMHQPTTVVDEYLEPYKSSGGELSPIHEASQEDTDISDSSTNTSATSMEYNINIVDSSVVLLESPESKDSDAIIFKVSQVAVTMTEIVKLNVTGVGMFLKRMLSDDSTRLRILDDFSFDFVLDNRGSNSTSFLTTIDANIEPLLLRLSLRDIHLALGIFNKASKMYNEASNNEIKSNSDSPTKSVKGTSVADQITKGLKKYTPSIISSYSGPSHSKLRRRSEPVVIIKGERLKFNLKGLRMVLIGDVHELPILDFDIKAFEVTAKNWSTELEAETKIQSLINIFNYSLSQWEPFLEPWAFAIHIQRATNGKMSVDFVSRQLAELTITSRSIATVSHFATLLSETGELKPRGEDSPYRIINQTGYDLNIWIDDGSDNRNQLSLLKDQATIPWSFEDWRQVRETLTINTNLNYIGVEFLDSIYDPIRNLSLKAEGEDVFMLTPTINDRYHNRIACEIVLAEDKVKEVVLKSTVTIQNCTPTAIHIGVGNCDGEFVVDREITISPGSKLALPVDFVYNGKLAIRPATTTEIFGWSTAKVQGNHDTTRMDWETLRDKDLFLACPKIEQNGVADYYYFKAYAEYDKKELLNQLYPHMNIVISPPLVLENLLPFDINWKLFQKGPKRWNDDLKMGGKCPIHVLDMNYSVVLKIDVLGSTYETSAAAIINTPNSVTNVDSEISLKNPDGHRLNLRLFYSTDHHFGTKISIYAPYLIVNRTGKNLSVTDHFNTLISKKRDLSKACDDEYPDMFSFGTQSDGIGLFKGNLENTVQLRVEDSYPSEKFSIDKIGQAFEVRVGLKTQHFENDVGVHITEGQGIYNLTKVIMIAPRYIIKNTLELPLLIGLVGSKKSLPLNAGEVKPIYDIPTHGEKQLTIGFEDGPENMSASFVINNAGENYIRVKKLNSNAHMLLRVVISTDNASIFINILDAKNLWPYSIRNFSDQEFFIYQANPYIDKDGNTISNKKFVPVFYRIPPKSVMPYAWDFPAAAVKELILRCDRRERFIQLAEIGSLMPMRVKKDDDSYEIFDLNVIADGPVQALMISAYDSRTSMYQLKDIKSNNASSNVQDEFETTVTDENYYTSVIFKFEGIGFSLINTNKVNEELCYTTLKKMEFRYNESDIYQTLSMKLQWFQVDNQINGSFFPVVIFPSIIAKSVNDMNNHPVFSASIARMKDLTHGVNYIKFATILLQELSIQVDEDFVWALLDFAKIPGAAWNSDIKNELWDKNLQIPQPPIMRSTDDLYFESLNLQPLQFNLSFVRTEKANSNRNPYAQNALSVAADVLTMAIGNINDAPVRLSSLFLENIRTPLPYLLQNITEHYKQAFLYQLYKVLGSADVLGNPVGLFNSISSGVMDIFYEPYQGYIMTDRPQELGIGLAKGGLSFVKKSVFGFSDSVSRFTNSVAKGLTVASMDKDFQERRRRNRQVGRANHPVDGLQIGATAFFNGISSGITGLATAPMEGATRSGTSGFFKGLGKGLIGLPTKTATGVFDLANNISESIKSTTTAFDADAIDKVRLPRYIPYDGSVVPYSQKEAQGQYWLKMCNNGLFADDQYLAHTVLQGGDYACVVSYSRILMINIFTLTVEWQIPLDNIINITLEKNRICVKTKNVGDSGKQIPLPDKAEKRFIYSQIAIAVNEYNKHCIVAL